MSHHQGRHYWIIGASSGIGEALARHLAKQGAMLTLSARSADMLGELVATLGAGHNALPLDICDYASVVQAAKAAGTRKVDSVVFLAAQYEPMDMTALDMTAVRRIIDVNLLGAFHVVDAVLPLLQRQNEGQLALCGSVAGYRGLPHGQPYSATKAAIRNLAESLRAEVQGGGIDIRLISPGFVRTALTDKNRFPMPCILTPEQAARHLADGLSGNAFEIHFPKRFTYLMKFLAFLPYPLYFRVIKRFS